MNILVTIEQRNGELKKASLEALSLGKNWLANPAEQWLLPWLAVVSQRLQIK